MIIHGKKQKMEYRDFTVSGINDLRLSHCKLIDEYSLTKWTQTTRTKTIFSQRKSDQSAQSHSTPALFSNFPITKENFTLREFKNQVFQLKLLGW